MDTISDEWVWCPVTDSPAVVNRLPVEEFFADRDGVVLVAYCCGCEQVVPELGVLLREVVDRSTSGRC